MFDLVNHPCFPLVSSHSEAIQPHIPPLIQVFKNATSHHNKQPPTTSYPCTLGFLVLLSFSQTTHFRHSFDLLAFLLVSGPVTLLGIP